MALGQYWNAGIRDPSKRDLMQVLGLSYNTVDTALKELEGGGWVQVVDRVGQANSYLMQRGPWVVPPVESPVENDNAGTEPPPSTGEGGGARYWGAFKASGRKEEQAELLAVDPPPREESPDVARIEVVPDNPPAPLGHSSSSASNRPSRAFGSREREAPRGALSFGLRKAFALPADLEAELAQRFTAPQCRALRQTLSVGSWSGRPDLACMTARILLERPDARDPEKYVHRLVDEALKRLSAGEPPTGQPPPPPTSDHPDDVQIAALKCRIRVNPNHPKVAQFTAELAELEARRLGRQVAS
jgi:hypothetical protein